MQSTSTIGGDDAHMDVTEQTTARIAGLESDMDYILGSLMARR